MTGEATAGSFLLAVIALLTSAITLLCLWLGKSWFVFFRGMYTVSARGRKDRRRIEREAGIAIEAPIAVEQVGLVP